MSNENEWSRPKKPYTVTPNQTGWDSKPKFKPKSVVVPAKNNSNNKVLHQVLKANGTVRITINNLSSTDKNLAPTYEGHIKSFDDFTILLETFNSSYLINKSSVAIIEFLKDGTSKE